MSNMSDIQKDLRVRGSVEANGYLFEYAGEGFRIKPGDVYISQRGDDVEILTAARVDITKDRLGQFSGLIYPTDRKKSVSTTEECVRVIITKEVKKNV